MFNSLRIRTIVIFVLINILLIVLLARFSYLFLRNLYLDQFHDQVSMALRVADAKIDRSLLKFLSPDEPSLARRYVTHTLVRLDSLLQVKNIFVFDQKGNVLSALQKNDAQTALLINKPMLAELKAGQRLISKPFKADDGQWYLWAFKRLSDDYFIGLRENAQRLAQINRLSGKFFLFGLLGVGLTFLAALFIARSIHAPLKEITRFSDQIGQGNFGVQAPNFKIKEMAQLTQALSQMRDALAQRDREKEQMLAQIAHELRNPLGGIELLAGLIRDDLPPDHSDLPYLEKILQEVGHLKEQINEFLHYSRPRPAEKIMVNLSELTDELQEAFAPILKEKRAELRREFQQNLLLFDREHLKHILSNLLLNSLQALNGQAGQITLRCANDTLEIEDNGPGIPPDERPKIFQPFFTTKSDGIGLGLTICQRLCRLNGASLNVQSGSLGGALFKIQLNTKDNPS